MIIGISGKMRVGKNLVGDYLCQRYGFKQVAFADALKKLGMEFFDLTHEECYGQKTARSRDVLQRIGTEAFRAIDPDVWCKYLLKNVKEGENIVITDVRFANEAEMVKKYGGKIIRINRHTNEQFGMSHVSETALDTYKNFDHIIDNNDSPEELYFRIDNVMKMLSA